MASTATNSFTGWDGTISISIDDGADYTPVGEVKKYGPAGRSMSLSDRTHLKSPGRVKQILPGMKESGTVTLDLVANPSDPGQLMLSAAYDADQLLKVKVEYPALKGMNTGLVQVYDAYVTKDGLPDLSFDVATVSVELTIDGVVTSTPGA